MTPLYNKPFFPRSLMTTHDSVSGPQVTANDPDAETNGLVTYSLEALPEEEEAGATQMFSIDGESGWITTNQEADCEAAHLYRFSVVATDNGSGLKLSSSVLVEVTVTDENDNPPKFSDDAYSGSVVENSSPGEVIVSMTTADADVSLENRLVTCYITGETSLFDLSQMRDFRKRASFVGCYGNPG